VHKHYCDAIDPRDMFRLCVYYQARVDKKAFGVRLYFNASQHSIPF
jgi:hypothetical protein